MPVEFLISVKGMLINKELKEILKGGNRSYGPNY